MKKIIHVDNSEFFRKQMKAFLDGEGLEVESFDTVEDANIAILGGSAAMVIMGLTFSDAEGDAFLEKVVESFAGPVIVVSSSIDKKKEKDLKALGVKAAINKSGAWQDALRLQLVRVK
jgi:chemotaxis response regulator CheB